jgi:hypothetical protein
MAIQPNPSLHPPRGWWYRHVDGTTIRGASKDKLVFAVAEYLAQLDENHEKAEQLVDEFICSHHPSICRETSRIMSPKRANSQAADLTARMLGYLAKTVRVNRVKAGGLPRVDPSVAKERADICRKCPHNLMWQKNCASCVEKVSSAAELLSRDGPEVETKGLKACDHHGYHLPTAVRIAFTEFDPGAPEQCWRRPRS